MNKKLENGNGHAHEETHGQARSTGYFLEKLTDMITENFEALHSEIEELEDKISKLEKLLEKK